MEVLIVLFHLMSEDCELGVETIAKAERAIDDTSRARKGVHTRLMTEFATWPLITPDS